MKRHTISPAAFALVAIVAGACVVLASCGGSSSGASTTGPSTSGPPLTIVLPASQMTSGTTIQASAMLGSSAATNVAWSSSDALVAAVNAAGVITGTRAGIATITAVSGNSTGTTTVQVNAGPPAVLSYYQGEGQIAPAGSFLADPLCTLVKDAAGNLIIGVAVTYTVATGGGIIREPLSPKTDARGVAVSGGFSLGPTPGVQTVIATSGTAPPLVFHETAQ
jgi:hypothetical protein